MMWTDDPVIDEKRRQERIYELPECEECGNRIDDDYYYDFDGKVMCGECVMKHKKWLW